MSIIEVAYKVNEGLPEERTLDRKSKSIQAIVPFCRRSTNSDDTIVVPAAEPPYRIYTLHAEGSCAFCQILRNLRDCTSAIRLQ